MPPADHPLNAAAMHHFAEPGKLIRGQIALAAGNMLDLNPDIAMQWALSVNFCIMPHFCMTIFVMKIQRRNQETIWKAFGLQQAICLGDWLVAQSFVHAAEADRLTYSLTGSHAASWPCWQKVCRAFNWASR